MFLEHKEGGMWNVISLMRLRKGGMIFQGWESGRGMRFLAISLFCSPQWGFVYIFKCSLVTLVVDSTCCLRRSTR